MENFPNNSDFEQDIESVVDDTQESVEQEADKIADERNREVGARILNAVGFRGRHQETVDHSYDMARDRKEHLVGKNDDRRIDAYLKRISRDIEKNGNGFERGLWNHTVDRLIIDERNIPENYWRTQEQIMRDNGGQRRELNDYEKGAMIEDIKERQRESIRSWTDYLAHEDCPYPIWFKVYTIDGVSKMSTFDNGKKVFRKRDKGTVAPYPHFNAAVLSKVYSTIADFYGIDSDLSISEDKESRDGQEAEENERADRDVELEALVRSGNFNKLYSRLLMSEKVIGKTPERAEDVHGEWVEYGIGQEEEIASAADGTPWCIASPSVAGSYLTTGGYGQKSVKNSNSKAKFILFRLQDEDGRLADNACASIRLDTEGKVAEISGLNEGQALEDSLVGTVEEKVKDLPGGEEFLKRFADKRMLIALDRKMQSDEDLTYDELRFVWEIDRPIEILDTYNAKDPRIKELRAKYNIDKLLSVAGSDIDINGLVSNLEPHEIFSNLDSLMTAEANADELVSKFYSYQIADNLDRFLAARVDTDVLVSKLEPFEIANNLDKLLAAGANINIDELVSRLDVHAIANNLGSLLAAGAVIDIDELVSKLDTDTIARNHDSLLAAGANIDDDRLISEFDRWVSEFD